ncbi:hypothetical protein M9434_002950 [Picochlorum sp. BPE23]|nr:hypothetical protein M9434_002950 [Picochlorum sp. BPE23]KAI8104993.1 hypothetical protein M9435_000167 [Picochlorum sp. BPE23]
MTTAHRPTWAPAKGGEEQGGMRFYAPSQMTSVKDTSGFTKMKYRQTGQGTLKELLEKDTRKELEEREQKHFSKMSREEFMSERENDLKLLESPGEIQEERHFLALEQDADEEDVSESDSDTSDDDEEAELLAELERIKQERAEEAAKAAAAEAAAEEKRLREEVSTGNPLLEEKLASHSDFRIKRRWDDDVVFRNQASKEPVQKRRFINDTIRNDFHRRFLDRYML